LLDRPGLDQLRADAKLDVYDAIHFLDADRITRDVSYQRIIIAELLKRGKQMRRGCCSGNGGFQLRVAAVCPSLCPTPTAASRPTQHIRALASTVSV
jgi:hypothetical protein